MVEDGLKGAPAVDKLPELVPSPQAATPMSTATSTTAERIDILPPSSS